MTSAVNIVAIRRAAENWSAGMPIEPWPRGFMYKYLTS